MSEYEEPPSPIVQRWSQLWAEVADEADHLVGKDEWSHHGAFLVAALLVVAERIKGPT